MSAPRAAGATDRPLVLANLSRLTAHSGALPPLLDICLSPSLTWGNGRA